MKLPLTATVLFASATLAPASTAQLFEGLETAPAMRSTNLVGFPTVTFTTHSVFEVNGMANLGDGRTLLIAKGPFSTDIYRSILGAAPTFFVHASIDLHGLGYGRNTLFGFSNFGSPMGVYSVNLNTGLATLAVDTSTSQLRFFALDYDPIDDLLYGYSEYGNAGLHAIDIDTGSTTRIAASIPAANTQGRGLAVGNHVVYLTATRGADGIASYAYDLRQGQNGSWTPFTNPYTADNATGGSTFVTVQQPWLGNRGPGRVTLSCVGQDLRSGNTATFRIVSTLANQTGYLLLGTVANPTFVSQLNATIVPYPPLSFAPIGVGANGWLEATLPGGLGNVRLVVQVLLRDPSIPTGFAVSNAIALDFLP